MVSKENLRFSISAVEEGTTREGPCVDGSITPIYAFVPQTPHSSQFKILVIIIKKFGIKMKFLQRHNLQKKYARPKTPNPIIFRFLKIFNVVELKTDI